MATRKSKNVAGAKPPMAEEGRFIDPIVDEPEAEPLPAAPPTTDENIEELEDGSAVIKLEEDEGESGDPEFHENLAVGMDPAIRRAIAAELIDLIERDKDARSKRDEQYAEGIKRTGLGNEAPGGADFDGSSRAVHPVLIEGCVDFAARAIKELFPPQGPVKTKIIGEVTDEKIDRADRKRQFMNWQLTGTGRRCIREYRAVLEQLLTQLPLGGSQFQKFWYDKRFERPRVEFVAIDKLHMPFSSSDFYTSPRVTHEQRLVRSSFEHRIAAGIYDRPYGSLEAGSIAPSTTASEAATEKIEGKEDVGYNEDGERVVYEVYIDYTLENDPLSKDGPGAYIITVDEATQDTIAIYRNWDQEDEVARRRLDWIVKWGFIPWRGAYDVGLAHIIGSLAGALIGGVRAILDAAHINNFPGAIKLKGARLSGQDKGVSPTQIQELEGPAGIDDIRKLAMPIPFNPPSTVLFELVKWLTEQAKGVVQTAEEKIADVNQQMPMGTALALIEQGSKVFSSIHSRMHESQARAFEIIHRINGETLEDEETVEELGELVVRREDFQGPVDIQPVSDPAIFSETQRLAQVQATVQFADSPNYAQFFKRDKLVKRFTQLIGLPNDDEVLNLPPEAQKLDPVTENMIAALGKQPLKVYPEQEHFAHIRAHLQFALSPMFGANPAMAVPTLPLLVGHIKEHIVYLYGQHSLAAASALRLTMGAQGEIEEFIPRAVAHAEQVLAAHLGPLMQQLLQLQELSNKLAPPPPQPKDPGTVQYEVGMAEVNLKKEQGVQQHEREMKRMENDRTQQQENARIAQQTEREQMTLEAWTTKFNAMQEKIMQDAENRAKVLLEFVKGEISRIATEQSNQFQTFSTQQQQQFDTHRQAVDHQFQTQSNLQTEATRVASDSAKELQVVRDALTGLGDQLKQIRESQAAASAPRKRVATPVRGEDGSVLRFELTEEPTAPEAAPQPTVQ